MEDGSLQINQMEFTFFDTDAKQIYYYFELNSSDKKYGSYMYIEIKKSSNMQFKMKPLYAKKIELGNLLLGRMLDSISIDEAELPSGNYDLIVNYLNDSNRLLTREKTSFQLLRNKEVQKTKVYEAAEDLSDNNIVDIEKTFVASYTLEQLQKNILALYPLSEGVELKVIKEIATNKDIKFLKQFFYNFWQNRDRQYPEKAWREYADKLNDVSKKYGTNGQPGYETDRGKIYLQFGVPDILERVVNEKDALPYEVWFYYSTKGRTNVKFLFYQSGMLATQMYLLHSTEQDIVTNTSWKQYLLTNPNDKDSKLMHRVFEYFK
jgi:GWxTD domain-containing protein